LTGVIPPARTDRVLLVSALPQAVMAYAGFRAGILTSVLFWSTQIVALAYVSWVLSRGRDVRGRVFVSMLGVAQVLTGLGMAFAPAEIFAPTIYGDAGTY